MKIYKSKHIFKSSIKDCDQINIKILQIISQIKKGISYVHPTISSTDWENKSDNIKEYFRAIEDSVMKHMQSMANYYKVKAGS